MKVLSADQCGVPIIRALGIDGPVISLTLHCAAGEMPTIEVHTYVMADGRYVVDPVDPDKLQEALRRYRLVLRDEAARLEALGETVLQYQNTMGKISIALFGDQNNVSDDDCVRRADRIGLEHAQRGHDLEVVLHALDHGLPLHADCKTCQQAAALLADYNAFLRDGNGRDD